MGTIDDDLIIDLETDGIDTEARPEPKVGPSGVRASALSKGEPRKTPHADRIAELERERDDAAKARDAERQRAAAAEAAAIAAHEARIKAEGTASERTEQAMRSHWAKINADFSQIAGAIAQTQSEADIAQKEWIAATEAGDAARAGTAQRAIAKAEAALVQLESGRVAAEEEIARTKRVYENYTPTKPEPAPKVEPRAPTPDEWIDSTRTAIGDDGAEWLRQNKQFATDPKLNRKLLRFADEFAEDHGQGALKSNAFIKALNDKFFPKTDAADEGEGDMASDEVDVAEEAPPARKTAPAAPVSRSSPARSANTAPNGKVRLSSDEQATAAQMYPELDRNAALKRYASNKARAIADGRYDNR